MRSQVSSVWMIAKVLVWSSWITPVVASGVPLAPSSTEQTAASADSEAVLNYCLNISDKAKEARVARQMAALKEIEIQVEAKIKELDERRGVLKSWVEKRKSLQEAAEKSLVEIYATMDAEAAAEQMTKLDSSLAASVLHQLKPRLASGILNEMEPDQAAKLVKIIASASDLEKASK